MENIFSVKDLKKTYKLKKRTSRFGAQKLVQAVDGVSFDIKFGETFGVVGETGCGKTTVAKMVLQLEKPSGGQMFFMGKDITSLKHKQLKLYRKHVQMIFQDPYSSLSPLKNIFFTVAEPLIIHKLTGNSKYLKERVCKALESVGLPYDDDTLDKRPDEFSGGERQRIGIAKALIIDPELVIADEPVSMLDASVRAEIVNLLLAKKNEKNLTYLFITHELDVAYSMCDHIAVMYAGTIVELAETQEIISRPQHPYTKLLIDAVPPLDPDDDDKWGKSIEDGECSYYTDLPRGCKFQARCKYVKDICREYQPDLQEVGPDHFLACYLQNLP